MSAFQVSDEHINAILQGVYGQDYQGLNIWKYQDDPESYHFKAGLREQCRAEANELMKQNIRSVNYRYSEKQEKFFKVVLNFNSSPMSALAVLKLIDCLDYQMCETPDYQTTEAYKLICKYRAIMVSKLPGWRDEKWSI